MSQSGAGVLHIAVGPAPGHAKSVLEVGDCRWIAHDIVIRGIFGGGESLGPFDVEMVSSRLEQHEVLVALVHRSGRRIIETGKMIGGLSRTFLPTPKLETYKGGVTRNPEDLEPAFGLYKI